MQRRKTILIRFLIHPIPYDILKVSFSFILRFRRQNNLIKCFLLILKTSHMQKSQSITILQIIYANGFRQGIQFNLNFVWIVIGYVLNATLGDHFYSLFHFFRVETFGSCARIWRHKRQRWLIHFGSVSSTFVFFFFYGYSQELRLGLRLRFAFDSCWLRKLFTFLNFYRLIIIILASKS